MSKIYVTGEFFRMLNYFLLTLFVIHIDI